MIIFEDVRLIVAIVSLFWLSTVAGVIKHYKKLNTNNKTNTKPEIKNVVQVVNVAEKYKDIIRQIIPHTLKGKKVAIKKILDENKISYQWD